MFEGVDKLPLYFISVFHGIVTAYLVYMFTDIEISDTYFIIFVIFCCVINIVTVRIILYLGVLIFSTERGQEKERTLKRIMNFDPEALLARPTFPYFILCLVAAIFSAYWLSNAYLNDWVFNIAKLWDLPKKSSRGILEDYFAVQCNAVRARDPKAPCKIDEYMEVWWKGTGAISVGYISQKPEGYRGKQLVQLSDACQLTLYNGELRYPIGKVKYQPGVTAFVDVNDSNVSAVQIVPPPNPCEVAAKPDQ